LLASLALGLLGCNRQSQPSPDVAYRNARQTFQRGELNDALKSADIGLGHYENRDPNWACRFRVLKAEILAWQGRSQESLALLKQEIPPSLASDEITVRAKSAQGIANGYLQNFEEAERALAEAEQLATVTQPRMLGEIALSKGVVAGFQRGDYAKGNTFFRLALQIAREEHQPFLEASALGDLGLVYMRRQQYGEANDWFSASRKMAQALGNRTLISKMTGNLGWCYYKLGDFDRALSLFTEAEALTAQLGLARDRQIWLNFIGTIYSDRGDYIAAEDYHQKALAIARELQNKAAMAVSLNSLALTAIAAGEFDRAEQYNREALELKRANHDRASELYSLLNLARVATGRRDFATAEQTLATVIREAGENIPIRWEAEADLASLYVAEHKLLKADLQFRRAVATVDKARSSLTKEEYRLSFLASAADFYNKYIDLLVSQGRVRDALQVAEHSRARTLAEGLGLDRQDDAFLQAAFRPEQTARKLNTVILSYWLKPGRSYLWAVTPDKITLFPLPAIAEIDAAAQAYRKALAGPRDVLGSANSHGLKLYELLVAPAQKLIPPGGRVTIIADGSLHGLNFETLLVPAPQVHYWIEDAVISDASSIGLLAAPRRDQHANIRNLLLVGDPVSPSPEYPPLAAAGLELQGIQEHFPANQRLVIAGEKAVPRAYRQSNPERFAYIHFVAHGTSSRMVPLDSGVILSRDGDDYKLYARDIMQQPLRADLVTISACYGAGTRAYSGEGLVGLAWAFLRAGAHNVIAASWEVNDSSTAQLMDGLYNELGKGQDPATALRWAKLMMLHSGTIYRRPFYWAAFQVYTGS
jgi:CHAT domain-containing protein/Flp pilus assembly protein TadD